MIEAMAFAREDPADRIDLDAASSGELTAGQRLQIRAGTAGDITTLLDEEVPAGKVWDLWIHVRGHEEDA